MSPHRPSLRHQPDVPANGAPESNNWRLGSQNVVQKDLV
jgi:hypothetical protein